MTVQGQRGVAAVAATVVGVCLAVAAPPRIVPPPPRAPADGAPVRAGRPLLPGPAFGDPRSVALVEVGGAETVVRLTPVDDAGAPVNGGRVVVLLAGERRTIDLRRAFPVGDLLGRRLLVETLEGDGEVRVEAAWLAQPRPALAATTTRRPSRNLPAVQRPTSEELIDEAESGGVIDHETAVLYRVFDIFGDARLPEAYRGDDAGVLDSRYLGTVRRELDTYSTETQAALQPFLMPPIYEGSWASPAAAAPAAALRKAASDFDPCTIVSEDWDYRERPGGKVRVWFMKNTTDASRASDAATSADTEIWPKLAGLMVREPRSDAAAPCNGGSDRLDIYLADAGTNFVDCLDGDCTYCPDYVCLRRTSNRSILAHEIFHTFQDAFSVALGHCPTDRDYLWWTEGSADWAMDFVYPTRNAEHSSAPRFLRVPEVSLDEPDRRHAYGTYLLPFFQHRSTDEPGFVRETQELCSVARAVEAFDAALSGEGLKEIWPAFAVHNYNFLPIIDYWMWDGLGYGAKRETIGATLSGTGGREFEVDFDLPPLSATYRRYIFSDPEVRSVAFWNGVTHELEVQASSFGDIYGHSDADPADIDGLHVHAFVKIAGQAWRGPEDWTNDRVVEYCRDKNDEDIEELVLVISNAQFADPNKRAVPPGLTPRVALSNMGCFQWKGTTRFAVTGDTTITATVDDLVLERVGGGSGPKDGQVAYVVKSGTLDVKVAGGCTGEATFDLALVVSPGQPPTAPPVLHHHMVFVPLTSVGFRGYWLTGAVLETFQVTCPPNEPIAFPVPPWIDTPCFPPALCKAEPDGSIKGSWDYLDGHYTWELQPEKEP